MVSAALVDGNQAPPALLEKLFELATAERDASSLESALKAMGKPQSSGRYAAWQFEALGGVLDVLDRRGQSVRDLNGLGGAELGRAIDQLDGLLKQARTLADSAGAGAESSVELTAALRVLGHGNGSPDLERLGRFLQPRYPVPLQQAALRNLGRARDKKAGAVLSASWAGCGPGLRPVLLNALLARREWVEILLTAIEQGRIPGRQIGTPEQERLRRNRDSTVRQRAEKLFETANPDRQQAVDAYRNVLQIRGDEARGALLFGQNCAACHKFHAIGSIGPDLGTVAGKPVATLLTAILDPNRAVEARYVNYTAQLKDGRELSGVIAAETSSSITLRSASGEETILRRDLDQLTSSGLSLMPEGFEKVLSVQDLADVIAFVRKTPNRTSSQ